MEDGPEVMKKRKVFAVYLSKVFERHPREITIDEEKKLLTDTTANGCPCNVFHRQ